MLKQAHTVGSLTYADDEERDFQDVCVETTGTSEGETASRGLLYIHLVNMILFQIFS
jgi:hypothetical protein